MSTTNVISQQATVNHIEWQNAAQLQNPDGSTSLGFAGAINGVSNAVLIVAGGANFLDKMPWEGGKKNYSNAIHVLEKINEEFVWNKQNKATLPEPIAYCGSTVTNFGVVYVGGENENGLSDKAFVLKWNSDKQEVETKLLPNFPIKITNIALTHFDNVVYAVGGDQVANSSDLMASLDLNCENPEWKTVAKLPFPLANSVVMVQKGEDGPAIYIVGGRTKTASGISDLHNTTFAFNIQKQTWKSCSPLSDGINTTNFSAGAGVALGDHSILIVGGDNGAIFHKIETYLSQIAQTNSAEEKAKLIAEKNILSTTHQGFYKGILCYNTQTNT